MELKYKYFHAIMPYTGGEREEQLNEILYKMECILECGYILPWQEVRELYSGISRNRHAHNNGDNRISIVKHSDNETKADFELRRKNAGSPFFDYAFEMFPNEEPAIVLNESLKKDFHILNKGVFMERQVAEPIPLKYMDAISIIPQEDIAPYFRKSEKQEGTVWTELYFTVDFVRKIRKLLDKYGYENIPIVNLYTGCEFIDKPVEMKLTQGTKNE